MEGRAVLVCCVLTVSVLAVAGQSLADPGVDAGGPYGGPGTYEHTWIEFNATTDNPANVFWRWDFDNDGEYDTAWRISLTMSDRLDRFYCDNYHGDILVDVWDGISTKTVIIDGEPQLVPDTVNDTARLDVYNLAPLGDLGGPYLGIAGKPIRFATYGMDPGCDGLTFIWYWGDGSFDMETYPRGKPHTEVTDERNHTYSSPGRYTVSLRLVDDDGGASWTYASVFVRGPLDDIDDLIDYTEGLPIPGGTRKGLVAQLNAARGCLVRFHEQPAVRILTAFTHRVEVLERRGALTEEQSDFMTALAHDIVWKIG